MGTEDRAESTLQRGRVPQWIWRPGDAVADRSSDGRVSAALAAAGRGLCEGRRTGIVDLVAVLPALLFFVFALVFALPFSHAWSFLIVAFGLLFFAAAAIGTGIGIMKRRRPKLDKSVASIKEQ